MVTRGARPARKATQGPASTPAPLNPQPPRNRRGIGFDCELRFDQRQQRRIGRRVLRDLRAISDRDERVRAVADVFVDEIGVLAERALPKVVIAAAIDARSPGPQRGT